MGFRTKIFIGQLNDNNIFFALPPTSNHLHSLKVDSNSRLAVDEDDSGKFRIEKVNGTGQLLSRLLFEGCIVYAVNYKVDMLLIRNGHK